MSIIEVKNLEKIYDNGVKAVKGVSFNVEKKQIFGMLGPNGAGKTTTIKMITTLTPITHGTVKLSGYDVKHDPESIRKIIGISPQDLSIDDDLKGIENIVLTGVLYGMDKKEATQKALELLDFFDLTAFKDKYAGSYSGGMKKRLDLACALVHEPEVLFLDEPTLGLDIQTRSKIWEYIRKLNKEKDMTIFLTTHYLEEADMLCDVVSIMDNGKIVVMDTPSKLKETVGKTVVDVSIKEGIDQLKAIIPSMPFVKENHQNGDEMRMVFDASLDSIPSFFEKIYGAGIKIRKINIKEPTMDDVFLHYTGSALRDKEEKTDSMATRRTMRRMRA